jgi:hypothetical protein
LVFPGEGVCKFGGLGFWLEDRPGQPDRSGITLLGVVGATLTDEPSFGRLGAALGFVVLVRWGYWHQRR